MDPLLTPSNARFTLMPIKYDQLWRRYKQAMACFWIPEEIDLQKDLVDLRHLNSSEKRLLFRVLAFFANADGIVNENLAANFATEVQIPEARYFYGFQIMMENVHAEVYSVIIQTYITDAAERVTLFHAMDDIASVKKKTDWVMKWLDKARPFCERLVAFAVVIGIFFSGSFAAIFWFRKRGLLPGLSYANDLIVLDESLHTLFAADLYRLLNVKTSDDVIRSIVEEALEAERVFMQDALPTPLLGLNYDLMDQYIQFVADHILQLFGISPVYKLNNPFDFMDLISLEGKANFFECRVSEYTKAKVDFQQREECAAQGGNFTTSEDF